MEIPNNSYLLFKKADTNNTDARIYYDANDTLIIGNLLTNFFTASDTGAITRFCSYHKWKCFIKSK